MSENGVGENGMIVGFPDDYEVKEIPIAGGLDIEMLKVNYLFGIEMSAPDGTVFPNSMYEHYLDSAIESMESMLDLGLKDVTIENEEHDYYGSDYRNWGFLQLFKAPVRSIKKLELNYGNNSGMVIPEDWIRFSKKTGEVSIVPNSNTASSLIISSSGALLSMSSMHSYVPYAWKCTYDSGFEIIPRDIANIIYMQASIMIMDVWGDLIVGAGIASQSVGLDGLSQSVSTTQSAMFAGASGRCEEYRKFIEVNMPPLKSKYMGLRMVVI